MLRNKNLVAFSHQHQHALALSVRIERALNSGDASLAACQSEIQSAFENEIESHFEAEEQILFPSAHNFDELRPLISRLLSDHVVLRSYALGAVGRGLSRTDLFDFCRLLSDHIRAEERNLFELCQRLMSGEELEIIGSRTNDFFRTRYHIIEKMGGDSSQ